MTRRERPDLGWHAVGWGALRRWWARRHLTDDAPEFTDNELEAVAPPKVGEAAVPPRWHTWARAILLVVIALLALAALRPPPLVAALVGATGTVALVWRAAQHRAERRAVVIERQRAWRSARARRLVRQRAAREEHAAAQAARDGAARAEREARRAANQAAHREATRRDP